VHCPWLAALLTLLWALSPIAQGSLAWFAVYGHVLVATFMLWLLGDLARRTDETAHDVPLHVRLRWGLLLFGAATSYGFGLGIALGFPVAALFLLPALANRGAVLLTLAASAALVAALYPVQRWLVLYRWGAEAIPFDFAPLGLAAIFRSPGEFVQLASVLLLGLSGYGLATLLLGPFALFARPAEYLGPWWGADLVWLSRSLVVAAVVLAVAVLRGAEPRRRHLAIGLGLVVAACYAPAAAVTAARLLASFPSQPDRYWEPTAVLEARYQYAGPAVWIAFVAVVLAAALDRWRRLARSTYAVLVVWFALAGPRYWAARDALVSRAIRAAMSTARPEQAMDDLRARVRRAPAGEGVYLRNGDSPFAFIRHVPAFPGTVAIFILFNESDVLEGRRVRFVEHDPELLRVLRSQGGRVAELLVGPEEVPAASPLASAARPWRAGEARRRGPSISAPSSRRAGWAWRPSAGATGPCCDNLSVAIPPLPRGTSDRARSKGRDARDLRVVAVAMQDFEVVTDRAGGDQAIDTRSNGKPLSSGRAIESDRLFEKIDAHR
jgi:hypothetical protein